MTSPSACGGSQVSSDPGRQIKWQATTGTRRRETGALWKSRRLLSSPGTVRPGGRQAPGGIRWISARTPPGRQEAARKRWHVGQPRRNAFERDVCAVQENDAAAGMNRRLERLGKQADQMEASMAGPPGPEAGS
jgi:hypothetical protein